METWRNHSTPPWVLNNSGPADQTETKRKWQPRKQCKELFITSHEWQATLSTPAAGGGGWRRCAEPGWKDGWQDCTRYTERKAPSSTKGLTLKHHLRGAPRTTTSCSLWVSNKRSSSVCCLKHPCPPWCCGPIWGWLWQLEADVHKFWRRVQCTVRCSGSILTSGVRLLAAQVPLDKKPGVWPIGIGEVLRRIVGKAILRILRDDITEAVGSLQLCAGHDGGVEAAIHAMTSIFKDDECEGVLLADAPNAFNTLNREACLQNVQHLCPAMAPIVINTYRHPAYLFVGGECILSSEGTTQGDPMARPMYTIGTIPLLLRSIATAGTMQAWFADDFRSWGQTGKPATMVE